jgi:hypothetical protein
VSRAICDPYKNDIPEWTVLDPTPKPLADALGPGAWPVCGSYERRKKRSDAGKRRGPRCHQVPLFTVPGETS